CSLRCQWPANERADAIVPWCARGHRIESPGRRRAPPAPVPARGGAMLTDEHRRFYREHGYVVVGGLFAPDEAARYRDHFMGLRRRGDYAGDFAGVDAGGCDPLKRYPRMIHMHRWDEVSLGWLL